MGLGWGRIVALRVSFLLDGWEGEVDRIVRSLSREWYLLRVY